MRWANSSSRAARNVGAEGVGELDRVDLVVAAQHDEHEPAVLHHHGVGLEQRALRHVQRAGDLGDRGQPGRRHLLGRGARRGQLDRRGLAARHLDVGGVAGRQRDVVLARRARRHVLVGAEAAHHPDVRLDPVPLEPAAVEDAVVGAAEVLVVLVEAGAVAVEGVGVLHDELARAQEPGARPRLVPALGLEVIRRERQLAVGAHDRRDVEGDDLLGGEGEHHVGTLAVLELEDLINAVTARALPQISRIDHRHQHLLAADGVHLLADDLRGVLMRAPAGGQERPEAGAELAHEARADHELVRERLGVGRGLLLGG